MRGHKIAIIPVVKKNIKTRWVKFLGTSKNTLGRTAPIMIFMLSWLSLHYQVEDVLNPYHGLTKTLSYKLGRRNYWNGSDDVLKSLTNFGPMRLLCHPSILLDLLAAHLWISIYLPTSSQKDWAPINVKANLTPETHCIRLGSELTLFFSFVTRGHKKMGVL